MNILGFIFSIYLTIGVVFGIAMLALMQRGNPEEFAKINTFDRMWIFFAMVLSWPISLLSR